MNDKVDNKKSDLINLSDQELKNRLDLYQRLSKDIDSALKIEKVKSEHQGKMKENEAKRTKQAIHYSQGQRAGLPQAPYQQLQYFHEREDEKLRNLVFNESKEVYDKTSSLSKEFSQSESMRSNDKKTEFHRHKNDIKER